MRDLIVILVVALFGMGLALWALRRWPAQADHSARGDEHASSKADRQQADRDRPVTETASGAAAGTGAGKSPDWGKPTTENSILAVLQFDIAPWNVTLTQPEVMIGRHSDDDVRIPDVRVSRHHARLVAKRQGGFEIHNLTAVRSEPNPMLINGAEREHSDIFDGDVVTLGGVSFTFKMAA